MENANRSLSLPDLQRDWGGGELAKSISRNVNNRNYILDGLDDYDFYTDADTAWAKDDKKVIYAMIKGLELINILT